jgi:hypothetical protein
MYAPTSKMSDTITTMGKKGTSTTAKQVAMGNPRQDNANKDHPRSTELTTRLRKK